jgi:hypothetical protein
MESGRIGLYRFTEVRRMTDPPDQFFGDVEEIGYEDGAVTAAWSEPAPCPRQRSAVEAFQLNVASRTGGAS